MWAWAAWAGHSSAPLTAGNGAHGPPANAAAVAKASRPPCVHACALCLCATLLSTVDGPSLLALLLCAVCQLPWRLPFRVALFTGALLPLQRQLRCGVGRLLPLPCYVLAAAAVAAAAAHGRWAHCFDGQQRRLIRVVFSGIGGNKVLRLLFIAIGTGRSREEGAPGRTELWHRNSARPAPGNAIPRKPRLVFISKPLLASGRAATAAERSRGGAGRGVRARAVRCAAVRRSTRPSGLYGGRRPCPPAGTYSCNG